jgi:hypothetical protein
MLLVPPLPALRSAPALPVREQSEALEALTVPLLRAWPVPRSPEAPLVSGALLVSEAFEVLP